jgi:deoxyribonuclease-4
MGTSESKAVKQNRVGAHVPTSGGLVTRALGYAQTIEAEAIQIFASNPRGWAMPDANPAADKEFREKAEAMDIATYVHAPFLINLGSPTEATYENSLASTEYSLKRSKELGALGTVIHTGSAVKEEFVGHAWKQIHDGMMPILEKLKTEHPLLLLEPTAGQGQSLVRRLDELIKYFDVLEHHPKVGICIDTCHVFAAGHDITTGAGIDEMLGALTAVISSDRIKLVHANDSMDICGSLKDRHQSIGEGHIGQKPFQLLMAHPAISGVPFILETPGEEPEHGKEVRILKKLRG